MDLDVVESGGWVDARVFKMEDNTAESQEVFNLRDMKLRLGPYALRKALIFEELKFAIKSFSMASDLPIFSRLAEDPEFQF